MSVRNPSVYFVTLINFEGFSNTLELCEVISNEFEARLPSRHILVSNLLAGYVESIKF